MGRFRELVTDRYNFAGMYATVSLTAGLCDVFFSLFSGLMPLQLIVADIVTSISGGSIFSSGANGPTLNGTLILIYAVGIAPFVLIYLAFIRGQRVGRRSLAVFPILGTVVVLLGGHPFTAITSMNAGLLPKLIAWCLDGLCLYHGALRRTKRDER